MSEIIIAGSKLSKRKLAIQKLFRPLSRSSHVDTFYRLGADEVLIGLGIDNFGGSLRSARHPSKFEHIFLNYFEVWRPKLDGKNLYLTKAYFHLDQPNQDGSGDEELLALHCDPAIPKTESSYQYKRGPHLHIAGARWDLSKAHIAMCLTNLDHDCSNIDTLTNALDRIIKMIDEELMPQFA